MAIIPLNFQEAPFQLDEVHKNRILTNQLLQLTEYHKEHCLPYRTILSAYAYQNDKILHYSDLPFLPIGIFKRLQLASRFENQGEIKTITSSGTSGQQVSKICLDGETRTLQQQALTAIGSNFLGLKRLPMLVIDCESILGKRDFFSARTAAVLGFSIFGKNRCFALNQNMELEIEKVNYFLDHYGSDKFLVFGFTYLIWKNFCMEMKMRGLHFDMSNGILVHGGGWKKLQNEWVEKEEFQEKIRLYTGIKAIHDYYGMAEQSGSIFMECEYGHLHCSDYSGIILRRPKDFSVCDIGERGMIQTLSVLPLSYPGHNILTEDEGVLLGIDDCKCGRKGAYFKVLGRVKNAEIRGCSDTYEKL